MIRIGVLSAYDGSYDNSLLIFEENNGNLKVINYGQEDIVLKEECSTTYDLWHSYENEEWEEWDYVLDFMLKANINILYVYEDARLCNILEVDENKKLKKVMNGISEFEVKEEYLDSKEENND